MFFKSSKLVYFGLPKTPGLSKTPSGQVENFSQKDIKYLNAFGKRLQALLRKNKASVSDTRVSSEGNKEVFTIVANKYELKFELEDSTGASYTFYFGRNGKLDVPASYARNKRGGRIKFLSPVILASKFKKIRKIFEKKWRERERQVNAKKRQANARKRNERLVRYYTKNLRNTPGTRRTLKKLCKKLYYLAQQLLKGPKGDRRGSVALINLNEHTDEYIFLAPGTFKKGTQKGFGIGMKIGDEMMSISYNRFTGKVGQIISTTSSTVSDTISEKPVNPAFLIPIMKIYGKKLKRKVVALRKKKNRS